MGLKEIQKLASSGKSTIARIITRVGDSIQYAKRRSRCAIGPCVALGMNASCY